MLEPGKRHLKKQLTFMKATQQIPQSVRTARVLVTTSDRQRGGNRPTEAAGGGALDGGRRVGERLEEQCM